MSRPTYKIRAFRLGVLHTLRADGSMSFETTDFAELRRELGDEILSELLRLFVWVDRVTSLQDFLYWSEKHVEGSGRERNLHSFSWFMSGVLYEATEAVDQLEGADITLHMGNTEAWAELRAMANRWQGRVLRRARNNFGFHADPNVIKQGIEALAASGERVEILHSDTDSITTATFQLGLEALLRGTSFTFEQYEEISKAIENDMGRFRELVQLVSIEVLRYHGAW